MPRIHFADAQLVKPACSARRPVLGLKDVDAITVSMARGVAQTVSLHTAAAAIAMGVLSNTGFKLAVAFLFGDQPFKWIAGGSLALMIVAAAAAFALQLP
jgi:uncharacterized membrane protein (DUF4010 family)